MYIYVYTFICIYMIHSIRYIYRYMYIYRCVHRERIIVRQQYKYEKGQPCVHQTAYHLLFLSFFSFILFDLSLRCTRIWLLEEYVTNQVSFCGTGLFLPFSCFLFLFFFSFCLSFSYFLVGMRRLIFIEGGRNARTSSRPPLLLASSSFNSLRSVHSFRSFFKFEGRRGTRVPRTPVSPSFSLLYSTRRILSTNGFVDYLSFYYFLFLFFCFFFHEHWTLASTTVVSVVFIFMTLEIGIYIISLFLSFWFCVG